MLLVVCCCALFEVCCLLLSVVGHWLSTGGCWFLDFDGCGVWCLVSGVSRLMVVVRFFVVRCLWFVV